MSVQFIADAEGKPAFAVLPYEEYRALIEALEDSEDIEALQRSAHERAEGREFIPDAVLGRLLDGDNPVRVWREYRGIPVSELAAQCEVTPSAISQIESGRRSPSVDLLRRLGHALNIDLELLVS